MLAGVNLMLESPRAEVFVARTTRNLVNLMLNEEVD